MALQKQIIEFPFSQGIDTKTDPIHLPTGRLAELVNAEFGTTGSVRKVPALRPLTDKIAYWVEHHASDASFVAHPVDTIEKVYSLFPLGDRFAIEAIAKNAVTLNQEYGRRLFVFSPEAGRWVDICSMHTVRYTSVDTSSWGDELMVQVASAHKSGWTIVLQHTLAGSVHTGFATLTAPDGAKILNSLNTYTGPDFDRAKVVGFAGGFLAVTADPAIAPAIYGTIYSLDTPGKVTPAGTTATTLYSDFHANGLWDLGVLDGVAWLVYKESVGGAIVVKRLDASGAELTTTTITDTPENCIGLCFVENEAGTKRGYVMYQDSADNDVKCQVLDSSGTLVGSPKTWQAYTAADDLYNITGAKEANLNSRDSTDLGAWRAVWEMDGDVLRTEEIQFDGDSVKGGDIITTNSSIGEAPALASKAFSYDGQCYFWMCRIESTQRTYFLMTTQGISDGSNKAAGPITVAGLFHGRAFGQTTGAGELAGVDRVSGGEFEWACLRSDRTLSDGEDVWAGATVRFDVAPQTQMVAEGQNTIIGPAARPWMWDGAAVSGLGFATIPVIVNTATPAGSMGAGTYGVRALYEWQAANGDMYRSTPSAQINVTLTANKAMTNVGRESFQPLTDSGKGNQLSYSYRKPGQFIAAQLMVYRTAAAGSVFHKEPDITVPLDMKGSDSAGVGVAAVDSAVADNEILYTNGGVLDNDPPPPMLSVAFGGNRAWALSADEPNRLYASKPKERGVGYEFSLALFLDINIVGTASTLIEMDGVIFVCSEQRIKAIPAIAPDKFGNGQFGGQSEIPTPSGPKAGTPIVLAPDGVFFQSRKGIMLLDRSRQVRYIGAPVEAYNDRTVTSAANDATRNRVVFALDDGETMLAYDYFVGQWSVETRPGVSRITAGTGGLAAVTTSGTIHLEDPGYFDPGAPMLVTTSWVRFAGVQGLQRIKFAYIVGEFLGVHEFRVTILSAIDSYAAPATQTVKVSAKPGEAWIRIRPKYGQCTAMKLRIEEIGGDGRGFSLSGLRFVGAVKSKKMLPATVTL